MKNITQKKSATKYTVSVVPLVKIPLQREPFFDYVYSHKISIGSLVKVPLGTREIDGVVICTTKKQFSTTNKKLKNVSTVLKKNFLTTQQLKLAKFISNYYFCPLGIVLKSFIPKQANSKHKTITRETRETLLKKISLTTEQKFAIQQILKKKKTKKICHLLPSIYYLLFGPASSGKTQVYFEIIKKILAIKKSQALLLVPELTIVAQEIERYKQEFGAEKIAVLHSKLSAGQFYKNWQAIKSGQAQIIIGTRQAVLAPFQNLKIVIIDEEQDVSFKQWQMAPRYDARLVAEKLANIFSAKILFGSATPRFETYHQALQKKIELLTLTRIDQLSAKTSLENSTQLVDMKNEYYQKGRKLKTISPLSKKLQAEINYNLKYHRQIILFINRQGMSFFSVCDNCKQVFRCPTCQNALIYQNQGNFKCLHCTYETSAFPSCSHCQGMSFKNVGAGTQKISQLIKRQFPNAKVARFDSAISKQSTKAIDKIWKDFSTGKIDILIGTQMITKAWDLPNVGLVGIIDADSLFDFPDFRTNEKAFSHLVQAIGRTNRIGSPFRGQTLIQTFHPENKTIQLASNGEFVKFYQQEISERQDLFYPPFAKIIKLTYQNKQPAKIKKETEQIFTVLKKIASAHKNIKVFPPQDPLVVKIGNSYHRQIIVKIKSSTSTPLPKKLSQTLISLPAGWIIDIDPVSLV